MKGRFIHPRPVPPCAGPSVLQILWVLGGERGLVSGGVHRSRVPATDQSVLAARTGLGQPLREVEAAMCGSVAHPCAHGTPSSAGEMDTWPPWPSHGCPLPAPLPTALLSCLEVQESPAGLPASSSASTTL